MGNLDETTSAKSAERPNSPSGHRFQTGNAASSIVRLARIVAWSLAVAIIVLSVVPAGLRPETAAPHNLEHFTIYFVTGLAFGLGYDCRWALLAVLFVLYAGAIEIAQLFVPGRHARLSDFVVDAFAMCIGLLITSLIRRLQFRI
jgi:VanZ family protein